MNGRWFSSKYILITECAGGSHPGCRGGKCVQGYIFTQMLAMPVGTSFCKRLQVHMHCALLIFKAFVS